MKRIPQEIEYSSSSNFNRCKHAAIAEFISTDSRPLTPTFLSDHAIIFLLKGRKLFYHNKEKFEVNEGHAILLKRGYYLMCQRFHDSNYHSLVFYFNESIIKPLWTKYSRLLKRRIDFLGEQVSVAEMNDQFQEFRTSLQEHLGYKGDFLSHLLANKFERLLISTLDCHPSHDLIRFVKEICEDPGHEIEYVVGTNLFNPLDIPDLAKLVGMSVSTFKRKFRSIYGVPPKQWILGKRLEYANSLLSNRNKTVSEIAFECGFESPSYFIKVFKAKYGSTPREKMSQNSHSMA